MDINILLYLCNGTFLKSKVVHNKCQATFDKFLHLPCHKLSQFLPISLSHILEIKKYKLLLFSEFFVFQCIGNRKLRGLARPLNVIQSSYNFAGFISMSKRNLKWDDQSYLRTLIFLGHTNVGLSFGLLLASKAQKCTLLDCT